MAGVNPEYVIGNACNSRVQLSLADHDELLYSDYIVKFKHDFTGKDDLRNHIRSSLQSNSRFLVAGNPAALAQVFGLAVELAKLARVCPIRARTVERTPFWLK
jgi:hypothetical protein